MSKLDRSLLGFSATMELLHAATDLSIFLDESVNTVDRNELTKHLAKLTRAMLDAERIGLYDGHEMLNLVEAPAAVKEAPKPAKKKKRSYKKKTKKKQ